MRLNLVAVERHLKPKHRAVEGRARDGSSARGTDAFLRARYRSASRTTTANRSRSVLAAGQPHRCQDSRDPSAAASPAAAIPSRPPRNRQGRAQATVLPARSTSTSRSAIDRHPHRTSTYRYKRPPKKRKAAPLEGPVIATNRRALPSVGKHKPEPDAPPPANDDRKPAIVTTSRHRLKLVRAERARSRAPIPRQRRNHRGNSRRCLKDASGGRRRAICGLSWQADAIIA